VFHFKENTIHIFLCFLIIHTLLELFTAIYPVHLVQYIYTNVPRTLPTVPSSVCLVWCTKFSVHTSVYIVHCA